MRVEEARGERGSEKRKIGKWEQGGEEEEEVNLITVVEGDKKRNDGQKAAEKKRIHVSVEER